MKVWIDKKGGYHYHKESCEMIQDPRLNYEEVELEDIKRGKVLSPRGHIYWIPCACMHQKRKSLGIW